MVPWMVAHRGAMADAPENTGAAFDRAIACFSEGIELDVQISSDGVPVVFHDRSLKKINGISKPVSDFTFQELSGFDWGGWFSSRYVGEPVLTLENVLSRYAGRTRLFIEIKEAPSKRAKPRYYELPLLVVEKIRNIVSNERIGDMFVLSFDPDMLKSAYLHDPDLNYVLNLHSPSYEKVNIDIDILYGLCISVQKLNGRFAESWHHHGNKIMTYACNTRRMIDRALDLGVDVVMTDDPCGLHEYFIGAADG